MSRHDEFDARLEALIVEFADVLGPRRCSICERSDDCPHGPNDGTSMLEDGVMLQDWVLVHRWARFDGAGAFWDWATSKSILLMEAIGILTAVRDNARDRLRTDRR